MTLSYPIIGATRQRHRGIIESLIRRIKFSDPCTCVNRSLKGLAMRLIPALLLVSAVSLAAASPSFATPSTASGLLALSAPTQTLETTKATKSFMVAQTEMKKKAKKTKAKKKPKKKA